MSRQRLAMLLIAAVIAVAAGVFLANRRSASSEQRSGALWPAFADQLKSISAVRIEKGGATVASMQKTGDAWTLKERDGYPVDLNKLRTLLTTLGDAKIVEEKTADPARYAAIGVEDLSRPGATGTQITVVLSGGEKSLIVGKSAGRESFVRRAGESRSYSVEPAITLDAAPSYWIDSRLIDVASTKIERIDYQPPAAAPYTLHRSTADGPFSLDGAPAGRKPADVDIITPAATTFTGLTADEVEPLGNIDFSKGFLVRLTLTDGETITLTGTVLGAKHWIQVTSEKNTQLQAKVRGRAFEVASYRYAAIFKPLDELLAAKDSPGAKNAAPAKPRLPTH